MTKKKAQPKKVGPAKTDKRTKAELRDALEKLERELADSRALVDRLGEDKSRLSTKLKAVQKKARSDAEDSKATRVELLEKLQSLERENREFRKKVEALEKQNTGLRLVIAGLRKAGIDVEGADTAVPTAGSPLKPAPEGDIDLPEGALEGKPETPRRLASGVKLLRLGQKEPTTEIFEKIRFAQRETWLEPGQSLCAREPFRVHVKLHLPTIPTEANADVDKPAYAVKVVARERDSKRVVRTNDAAGLLTFGVADYERAVDLPGLECGRYLISVGGVIPFARIEARKQVELTVS